MPRKKNPRVVNGKRTPEYSSWYFMIYRCTQSQNPSNANYYGNVGVCKRWLKSFDNFCADMGPRPPGTSLDRYPDPYGNYKPSNCRWATRQQQSNNMTSSTRIDIGMFTGTVSEWSRALKLPRVTIDWRWRNGFTPYETLFTPVVSGNNQTLRGSA